MNWAYMIAGAIGASLGTGMLTWLFDRQRWNRHPQGRMGDLKDRLITSAGVGLAVPFANEVWRWPTGAAIAAGCFLMMVVYGNFGLVREALIRLNRTRYPAETA